MAPSASRLTPLPFALLAAGLFGTPHVGALSTLEQRGPSNALEREGPGSSALYAASEAPKTPPPPKDKASVEAPKDGAALLDWPGLEGICPGEHVRDVRWSSDGKRLALQRDDGRAISLCVMLLTQASGDSNLLQVKASRLSSVELIKTEEKKSKAQELAARERQISEWEFQWAPSLSDANPTYPSAALFTVQRVHMASRIFGVDGLNALSGKVVPFDGRPVVPQAEQKYDVYQATWRPSQTGKVEGGITAVSNAGLTCGKSRLVYIPEARCATTTCSSAPRPLTTPCVQSDKESANAADRYPTWDPVAAHDRLAFIRTYPGRGQRVCVLTRPLAGDSSLACTEPLKEATAVSRFYPTWSADGRFLAYYEMKTNADAPHGGTGPQELATIKVLDLESEPCKAGVSSPGCQPAEVLKGVLPNSYHGPTLVRYGERTMVFAISRTEDAKTVLVGRSLDVSSDTRRLDPRLENIKSMDVVVTSQVVKFAVVAQGYRERTGADQDRDKVFLYHAPTSWW